MASEPYRIKRQLKYGPRLTRKELAKYLLEVCRAREDKEAVEVHAGSCSQQTVCEEGRRAAIGRQGDEQHAHDEGQK